jgi:hypothetical protein
MVQLDAAIHPPVAARTAIDVVLSSLQKMPSAINGTKKSRGSPAAKRERSSDDSE